MVTYEDDQSRLPSPSLPGLRIFDTQVGRGWRVEPPCERNVNSVVLLPGESLRSKVPPFLRSLPPPWREHAREYEGKGRGGEV